MKTLEEIQEVEKRLREDKKNGYCLCYALTKEVCQVCKGYMDMDPCPYASCSPLCKIHKGNLFYQILNDKPKKVNSDKGMKFVTFTRPGKEETDHLQLFKTLKYIKKAKAIDKYWYSFEYQENGNPHLHCVIHMKQGYYFRDIARMLIKNNEGGYMDEQNQKGTLEEAQKYLYKDILKTEDIIKNLSKNYFFANNIKPNSQ